MKRIKVVSKFRKPPSFFFSAIDLRKYFQLFKLLKNFSRFHKSHFTCQLQKRSIMMVMNDRRLVGVFAVPVILLLAICEGSTTTGFGGVFVSNVASGERLTVNPVMMKCACPNSSSLPVAAAEFITASIQLPVVARISFC